MENGETEAVKTAIETAVRFASLVPVFDGKKILAPGVDLYDFAAVVGTNARSQAARHSAASLMGFIKSKVVMAGVGLHVDQTNGYDYAKAGGIAINMTMKVKPLPNGASEYLAAYPALSLSQNSQWDEFVAWCDGVWRE